MIIRKLTKDDKKLIDDFQIERGFSPLSNFFYSNECEWVIYAAIDNDKIISIAALFPYRRFPSDDYPYGYIAELGSLYTIKEYRNKGIATFLLEEIFKNLNNELPLLDAVVVDSTDEAFGIYEKFGFEKSTENRQWKRLK